MADLHLSPFTPDLGEVINILEVHFGPLLEDFTCAVQVGLGLAGCATLFVELSEVDIQSVEVCGCAAWVDC